MKPTLLLLPLGGLLAGLLAATFIYTVEQPVYGSKAVCRPIRPEGTPGDVSHREWLNTEAGILGSAANFQRVTRDLNLEHEWKLSGSECVSKLQKTIQVTVRPDTSLIEITSRGEKPETVATLVNATLAAREAQVNDALHQDQKLHQYALQGRVTMLTESITARRAALCTAAGKENPAGGATDEWLATAALAPELEPLRQAWQSEKRQLDWARDQLATAMLPANARIYAEILQKAEPVLEPVGPLWTSRALPWSLAGAAAGLAAGAAARALGRRQSKHPDNPRHPVSTPLEAAEF